MALSKTFANGSVLTAADVNTHLVNHVPSPGSVYDTGWVSLASFVAAGFTSTRFHARRVGLAYSLRGLMEGSIENGTINISSAIPAEWRPTENEFSGAYLSGGYPCTLLLRPNGVLAIVNRSGTQSGCQFSITFTK